MLSFAALQDTQRLLVQHGGAAACAPHRATPCAPRPTDVADGAGRGAAKARSARPGDPPTCTDSFTSKLAPWLSTSHGTCDGVLVRRADGRHGTGKAGSLNSSHFQIDILRQSSALQASSASVVLPLCLHYYCAPPLPLLPTAASAPAQLAGCRLVLPSSVSRAARFCSSAEQEL